MRAVDLGWGQRPKTVQIPVGATVLATAARVDGLDWAQATAASLAAPVGSAPLQARLKACSTVCVLVPDQTRKNITDRLLPPLLAILKAAGVEVVVGVATGKHPWSDGPAGAFVHDAEAADLRCVGTTAAGTRVCYPPAVLDADLRILVGEIRPHYFAGYAGGAKTLFPGVAGVDGIWHNHRLKALPGARLGCVDGNPCRDDMEAAAQLAGPAFIINIVRTPEGELAGIVAGDPILAHRHGVALARRIFEVEAPGLFDMVLVSDAAPVTMNLYQACKLLPPAGCLLKPGGLIVLAAACYDGIGPVEAINEGIYRLGVRHALPSGARVVLVSERSRAEVLPTFATWAPTVAAGLALGGSGSLVVIPHGGEVVPLPAR